MKEELKNRFKRIDIVKDLLKQKFVGLEKFVDNVIEQIIPWYVFQIKTETPVVINIWGITGTGKSEFVKTLCELLEVKSIVFDSQVFLNSSGRSNFNSTIEQEPNSVIVVEEFHRIKTIRDQDDTIQDDQRYILWELLSGTLNVRHDFYQAYGLFTGYDRRRWMEEIDVKKTDKKHFVYEVMDALRRYERYPLTQELVDKLDECTTEKDTATFFKKCEEFVSSLPSSRKVSTRNNLIFIVGNLDGAYKRVVEDLEVLDADDVSERMSKISNQECKEALLKMFSPEQVARLGSNHFVMPTLTKKGYQEFIHNKIYSLIKEYYYQHKTYVYVDQSVYEMLYQQIVIPTQGLRNVISGLNILFYSPMLVGLSKIIPHAGQDLIVVKYQESKLVLSTDSFSVVQPLEMLNQYNHYSEGFLKLVSTHEAGHAVMYYLLNNKAPVKVVAVSNSSKYGGYVKMHERDFETKENLINTVKTSLGGFFAEKLIFGEEKISTGSYADLIKASMVVSKMVNEFGFGSKMTPMRLGNPLLPAFLRSTEKDKDKEIHKLFEEYSKETEKMILENKDLICALAQVLIERKFMNEHELTQFFQTYKREKLNESVEA